MAPAQPEKIGFLQARNNEIAFGILCLTNTLPPDFRMIDSGAGDGGLLEEIVRRVRHAESLSDALNESFNGRIVATEPRVDQDLKNRFMNYKAVEVLYQTWDNWRLNYFPHAMHTDVTQELVLQKKRMNAVGRFDLVLHAETFQNYDYPEEVLEDSHELVGGGRVAIVMPQDDAFHALCSQLYAQAEKQRVHQWGKVPYSSDVFRKTLADLDYEVAVSVPIKVPLLPEDNMRGFANEMERYLGLSGDLLEHRASRILLNDYLDGVLSNDARCMYAGYDVMSVVPKSDNRTRWHVPQDCDQTPAPAGLVPVLV